MKSIFNTSKALREDGTYDIGSPDVYSLLLGGGSSGYGNWDYVVLNDRTYYPAKNTTREKTIQTLITYYVPIFQSIGAGAIPVFISTHAYRVPSNKTKPLGDGDIHTYTSLVSSGVEEYTKVLSSYLTQSQTPRIAYVGYAFEIVYQENYTLWERLFNIDDYHPSPHGTYLQGCIVYCTLFGTLPSEGIAVALEDPADLFEYSRVMQPVGWTSGGDYLDKPTVWEAGYLYDVAGRVCMR